MNHIDLMRRAIEFRSPERVPIELVDVPFVYDAYGTLDPAEVKIPAGAEEFDSLQATYHWTLTEVGRNKAGERLRRDEWGCLQRIPHDENSTYEIIERPLQHDNSLSAYTFPDPSVADPYFERIERVIKERYQDRFVCGYLDPGPFIVAFALMGYEGLLMRLVDDLERVKEVIHRIVDYQIEIVHKWEAVGAHMVCVIDEIAGTSGLMFSPDLWRQHFKSEMARLFHAVHRNNMFVGCLLDGDISAIFNDIADFDLDVIDIRQPRCIGIERWAEAFAGKICLKASVDMMTTLAEGSPTEVEEEARQLRTKLGTEKGGFIGIVLRWHRPRYREENVEASVRGFLAA